MDRVHGRDDTDIRALVAHLIAEELDLDADPAPELRLVEDLNADSLDLVEITMCMEEEFDLDISDDDFQKWVTVGDVAEYVATHVPGARP